MKKLLLVVILFLFASNLFAQSEVILKFVKRNVNGQESYVLVSDSPSSGYDALPVKIVGGGGSSGYTGSWDSVAVVRLNSILAKQTSIEILQSGSTISLADYTTCTTETDSITVGALYWYKGDISISDTVKAKVSLDRTFPAGRTWWVFPNQLLPLDKIDATTYPKIYIKRVASSRTVSYQYRIWGK